MNIHDGDNVEQRNCVLFCNFACVLKARQNIRRTVGIDQSDMIASTGIATVSRHRKITLAKFCAKTKTKVGIQFLDTILFMYSIYLMRCYLVL